MATSTTVNTRIIVNFEDKFTEAACQSLENYKKCLEDALNLSKQNPFSFLDESKKEFDQIFQSVNQFEKANNILLQEMLDLQQQSEESGQSLDLLSQGFERLENDARKANTALLGLGIPAFLASLTVLPALINIPIISLGILYGVWKVGETLPEWKVNGQSIDEYLKVVRDSFENLASARPLEFQLFSPDISEQLIELDRTKRLFEEQNNLFLHLNLVDNATQPALQLRQDLEAIYSEDIIQRIKVIQETAPLKTPNFFSQTDRAKEEFIESISTSDDDAGFDNSSGFDGSSVNPDGFTTFGPSANIPGFASGIDRVPRDMLAIIHKDEAVLPKNRAEEFRRGDSSSGGMNVQKFEVNIHVPNALNLDREAVSELAITIGDELER